MPADEDAVVGSETPAEAVHHAVSAALSVILLGLFCCQVAATRKKDALLREMKRNFGISSISHHSIYAPVGPQNRLFHYFGLALMCLLIVRATDPLDRLFIPATWLRLLSWNMVSFIVMTAAMTFEIQLRLSVLLKKRTDVTRYSKPLFIGLSVLAFATTNITFILYVTLPLDKADSAFIAHNIIFLFIEAAMLVIWDLIFIHIRRSVLAVMNPLSAASSSHQLTSSHNVSPSPSSPISPNRVSTELSPRMPTQEHSSPAGPTTSTDALQPLQIRGRAPSTGEPATDAYSFHIMDDQHSSHSLDDISKIPALTPLPPTAATKVVIVSSEDQKGTSAALRSRSLSRTPHVDQHHSNKLRSDKAVVSALRKMTKLTVAVHLFIFLAWANELFLLFVTIPNNPPRGPYKPSDMVVMYGLLAIAAVALWYSWRPHVWHIVMTPLDQLVGLVKPKTDGKRKDSAVRVPSASADAQFEQGSGQNQLPAPSDHITEDSNEHTHTGSGSGSGGQSSH